MQAKPLFRSLGSLIAGVAMVLGGGVMATFTLRFIARFDEPGHTGLSAGLLFYVLVILVPAVALFLLGLRVWRKSHRYP